MVNYLKLTPVEINKRVLAQCLQPISNIILFNENAEEFSVTEEVYLKIISAINKTLAIDNFTDIFFRSK